MSEMAERQARLPRSLVWLALAGIMALGIFLSVYRLEQTPPGLHHDEAYYMLDALRVGYENYHPIFFEKNNGREPLFIYLLALVFRLVEPSILAARLTSAVLAALTLPAVFLLVKEALSDADARLAEGAGLFSALVLATLYWHVNYSRLALRAVSFPLLEALALLLFWRAIRTRRRLDFIWAGLVLGVSMYSYLAARLLVPFLGLLLILLMLEQRDFLRRHWRNIAWLFGVALLVSLPLWVYFAGHPEFFIYRVRQITLDNPMALADSRQDTWSNLWRTLLMFTTHGDWGWPDNLPGRPVFDAVGMVAFFLGLAVAGLRFRKARYTQWPIWIAIMVIPIAFTVYPPNYTRSIGAVVPIAGMAGIGLASAWWLVSRRLARRWMSVALLAGLLLGVGAYSGWATYRDYFLIWAHRPELEVYFNSELRAAEQAILALPDRTRAYVSFAEPDPYDSALDFAIQRQRFVRPPAVPKTYTLRWHARTCLVLPVQLQESTAYLLPISGETFLPTLQTTLPAGKTEGPIYASGGRPLFTLFQVAEPTAPEPVPITPQRPVTYTLGDSLTLLGADLSAPALNPGQALTVTLYWRVDRPLATDETVFVQLLGDALNAQGNPVWGQRDEMPCQATFPTSVWEAGTLVLTRYQLPLAENAPAGRYRLVAGMYLAPSGPRLPARDAGGQPVPDNSIPLGVVEVR